MRRRTRGWCVAALLGLGLAAVPTLAADAPTFKLPRDRAAWTAERESIRETVWKALGDLPPRPHQPQLRTTALEPRSGVLVAGFEVGNANGVELRGILALPPGTRGVEQSCFRA